MAETMRMPRSPGRYAPGERVDPEADTILRMPDPGAAFPEFIYYSPQSVGVDFISTDNMALQSIIAEHVAFVESTPITFNVGSTVNATMEWRDGSGALKAEVRYDDTVFGVGFFGWTLVAVDRVGLLATGDVATPAAPHGELQLVRGATSAYGAMTASAGIARGTSFSVAADSGQAEFDITAADSVTGVGLTLSGAAVVTNISLWRVPDVTSRVRFDVWAGLPATSVDMIGGNVLFNTPLNGTCTAAGQNILGGVRAVATAATQAWGSHIEWRHIRSNAAGTAFVTPASVTIGGSFVSTNAVTNQIRFLSSLGGIYTCNSIAAGVLDILVVITVN